MNMRFGTGGVLRGGMSTGSQAISRCFTVDSPQDMYQCDVAPPWSGSTQYKFSGIYPICVESPVERHVSGQRADSDDGELRADQRANCAVARPRTSARAARGRRARRRHYRWS